MGVVYSATRLHIDDVVAIKILRPELLVNLWLCLSNRRIRHLRCLSESEWLEIAISDQASTTPQALWLRRPLAARIARGREECDYDLFKVWDFHS